MSSKILKKESMMFNLLFEKEVLKRELIKADFDVEQGVADGGKVADQGASSCQS